MLGEPLTVLLISAIFEQVVMFEIQSPSRLSEAQDFVRPTNSRRLLQDRNSRFPWLSYISLTFQWLVTTLSKGCSLQNASTQTKNSWGLERISWGFLQIRFSRLPFHFHLCPTFNREAKRSDTKARHSTHHRLAWRRLLKKQKQACKAIRRSTSQRLI